MKILSLAALSVFLLVAISLVTVSSALAPQHHRHHAAQQRSAVSRGPSHASIRWRRHSMSPSSLGMSKQFDLSRPQFDLYALRQVRGDALTKYNSLNQSEPLRLNLSLFLCLTFTASPWLAEELNDVALTVPQTALAVAGAVAFASLFGRECQARNRQLMRLEKELEALSLPIKLPTNRLADQAFEKQLPIMSVIRAMNCRIIAISGTSQMLSNSLLTFRVLRRRLLQANTFVVVVPTDVEDSTGLRSLVGEGRWAWLAEPGDLKIWRDYFSSLTADQGLHDSSSYAFRWLGLTPSGRSFGSGTTEPSWIQVFGRSLSPTEILSEEENDENVKSSAPGGEILQHQKSFYDALTNGKIDAMKDIFDTQVRDDEVSAITDQGGRLDSWENCLQDDARPAGMKIAGCDFYLVHDNMAYTTCIEFPAASEGNSLLAVQKWKRGDNGWKLQQHQTIPWTPDTRAAGTLICDHRGCVSLVRTSNERKIFGGLRG